MAQTAWTEAEKAAAKPWAVLYASVICAEIVSIGLMIVYLWRTGQWNSKVPLIWFGLTWLIAQVFQTLCYQRLAQIRSERLRRSYWVGVAVQAALVATFFYAAIL